MVHPFNTSKNYPAPVFSSGVDGNVTFDGSATVLSLAPSTSVYTLTRDIYPDNMTVNAGVTIKTQGFCIFVKGTLTNAGTISFNGVAASGSTGGAGYSNMGSLNVTTGAGANGRATTGAGSNGSGTTANNIARSVGGNGGTAGGGNGGGTGNTTSSPADGAGDITDIGFAARRRLFNGTGLASPNCGGGGGSGGCNTGTGTATSGGGGGAAGAVLISCAILINSGTISANGGVGGDGVFTGNGEGAGGGGGSGGWVWVAAGRIKSQGTITASGGTGGVGNGGTATGGSNGTAGRVILLAGS